MKKLKMFVALLMTLCLMMSLSVPAFAATKIKTSRVLVDQGYTADGIYYEVYDVTKPSDGISPNAIITVHVIREVEYYAILDPYNIPNSIEWSEQLDAYTMLRGTLYKKYWNFTTNQHTIVGYEGDLMGRV